MKKKERKNEYAEEINKKKEDGKERKRIGNTQER